MVESLTTERELESRTRDMIELYRPSFTDWEYKVQAGTHSPKNIWGVFTAKKIEIEGHYLLLGERKNHNLLVSHRRNDLTAEEIEMVDKGNPFRGIAHS